MRRALLGLGLLLLLGCEERRGGLGAPPRVDAGDAGVAVDAERADAFDAGAASDAGFGPDAAPFDVPEWPTGPDDCPPDPVTELSLGEAPLRFEGSALLALSAGPSLGHWARPQLGAWGSAVVPYRCEGCGAVVVQPGVASWQTEPFAQTDNVQRRVYEDGTVWLEAGERAWFVEDGEVRARLDTDPRLRPAPGGGAVMEPGRAAPVEYWGRGRRGVAVVPPGETVTGGWWGRPVLRIVSEAQGSAKLRFLVEVPEDPIRFVAEADRIVELGAADVGRDGRPLRAYWYCLEEGGTARLSAYDALGAQIDGLAWPFSCERLQLVAGPSTGLHVLRRVDAQLERYDLGAGSPAIELEARYRMPEPLHYFAWGPSGLLALRLAEGSGELFLLREGAPPASVHTFEGDGLWTSLQAGELVATPFSNPHSPLPERSDVFFDVPGVGPNSLRFEGSWVRTARVGARTWVSSDEGLAVVHRGQIVRRWPDRNLGAGPGYGRPVAQVMQAGLTGLVGRGAQTSTVTGLHRLVGDAMTRMGSGEAFAAIHEGIANGTPVQWVRYAPDDTEAVHVAVFDGEALTEVARGVGYPQVERDTTGQPWLRFVPEPGAAERIERIEGRALGTPHPGWRLEPLDSPVRAHDPDPRPIWGWHRTAPSAPRGCVCRADRPEACVGPPARFRWMWFLSSTEPRGPLAIGQDDAGQWWLWIVDLR